MLMPFALLMSCTAIFSLAIVRVQVRISLALLMSWAAIVSLNLATSGKSPTGRWCALWTCQGGQRAAVMEQ